MKTHITEHGETGLKLLYALGLPTESRRPGLIGAELFVSKSNMVLAQRQPGSRLSGSLGFFIIILQKPRDSYGLVTLMIVWTILGPK